MVIKLRGYITEDGEIKIYDIPDDHPVGEVEIIVYALTESRENDENDSEPSLNANEIDQD